MAGIGVKLNKIFQKNTITSDIIGFGYSTVVTIAPMLVVIADILLMRYFLGFSDVLYSTRMLFACTVLYIFIFGLLSASPFNAVLSKYISDVIYDERYEDILPCYYVGLVMNISLSCLIGIPFCIWEYVVGHIDIFYVFTGFCGYISLVIVFYSMIYLSICKDYQRISLFFGIGMVWAFLQSLFLYHICGWPAAESMLLSLTTGFFIIACLETALIKRYFVINSNRYRPVLRYFKKYWQLVLTNFFYILGLYIHNFVFWTTDLKMTVANSFVCAPSYDMATCIAMFTNISASVIFISRVEMHFHERYRDYSEAVIGGKGADIETAKKRMFGQLSNELMNLVRIQFIISVILYLLCVVILPQIGYAGRIMRIYPCVCAGYFILFLMYSAIIFLYYYNDTKGSLATAFCFCIVTFAGSIIASYLSDIWYGIGVVAGSFVGFAIAYRRLQWIEKNIDAHVFCRSFILPKRKSMRPSDMVYKKELK